MKVALLFIEAFTFGSFVWAGLSVFKNSNDKNKGVLLTKIVGTLTIALNIGALMNTDNFGPINGCGLILLAASCILFWKTISTIKNAPLSFAFAHSQSSFVYSNGPFAVVRHPFYLSYSMAWVGGALAAQEPLLLMPALIMVGFYIKAARAEEAELKKGPLAAAYQDYSLKTGMFFPKVIRK